MLRPVGDGMATLVALLAPLFRAGPEEGPGLSSRPMDRVAECPPAVAAEPRAAAVVAASQAGAEDTRVAEEECLRVAESPQGAAPALAAVAAGITNPLSH
jgi:hypothetical protein